MTPTPAQLARAEKVVARYTAIAAVTGAIPVPSASAAVVVENGAMFTELASVLGAEITWSSLVESIGFAGGLNFAGRALFVEGARMLGFGVGGPFAAALVSGLGATTAGVQTYTLGLIAIEIGKNGGEAITGSMVRALIEKAKNGYRAFLDRYRDGAKGSPDGPEPLGH